MDRRTFIGSLATGILSAPFAVDAQPTTNVRRIAYLSSGDSVSAANLTRAFLQGLGELGYVDGQNIVVESRYAEGNVNKLPPLAAELLTFKPDVVFAPTGVSVEAVKKLTSTTPIVFAWIADPVGGGYVASLAHPGNNLTGLSTLSAGLALKRLELLREVLPQAKRIAILFHPRVSGNVSQQQQTYVEGKALGIEILPMAVKHADDLEVIFSAITDAHPDALIVLENPVTFVHRERILNFVTRVGLPIMSDSQFYSSAGALLSYSVDMSQQFRHAATYVDKILKGAKPSDLAVEQPTKFELVINLKTANALRLTIPQSLLLRADEVIR